MPRPRPALIDHLGELEEALAGVRLDNAATRARYTQDLIFREGRERRLEAEIRAEKARLLREPQPGVTLRGMPPVAPPLPRPGGVGRPFAEGDPLAAVGNLALWARDHGVDYSLIKRWKAPGKSGAPIPQHYAEMFREVWGVPLSYWPHGIRPPRPYRRPRRGSPRWTGPAPRAPRGPRGKYKPRLTRAQ